MEDDSVLWPTSTKFSKRLCLIVFPGDQKASGLGSEFDAMRQNSKQASDLTHVFHLSHTQRRGCFEDRRNGQVQELLYDVTAEKRRILFGYGSRKPFPTRCFLVRRIKVQPSMMNFQRTVSGVV
ncbi:hypothetical protein N7460_007717 [Penicillium canescens]|uniref:Uncharacterized protein n=1 Tax=Penicillium canescens TaxID=5083 RepID=A0AAD6I8G8_PENCN|nr:hypothetical protein N7460_007717 [Penicillium canescens]